MRDRSHIAVVREESLGRLVARAADLAQRVAMDEFRLLRIESREELASLGMRAAGLAFGSLCGALAWIALSVAVVASLENVLPFATRLGLVGVAQAALGAALVAWTFRDPRR